MTDTFPIDGVQVFPGAIKACMLVLENALAHIAPDEAGTRLHGIDGLTPLLATSGCIGAVAATVLGPSAKPVRAILFNKTPEANWGLGWHQDRTTHLAR